MKMYTKKIVIWICVLILIIPCLVWGGSLVKNYIVTASHKEEIESMNFVKDEESLPELDWYRIISYSEEEIEIYFVNIQGKGTDREYKIGGKMLCYKTPEGWRHSYLEESVLWSKAGSADDYIWPYWHHVFF